jgi:hypothetical protein
VPDLIFDESFENASNNLGWYFSGDSDWYITNQNSSSGNNSFRSGVIENNQESSLLIDVDFPSASTIEFSYRVSSEYSPSGNNFYDGLTFYIDNIELGQFQPNEDGDSPWISFSTTISEGNHTLKWTYSKDGGGGSTDCNNTNCDDAAFIDDFRVLGYLNSQFELGDVNLDNEINILDAVILVNFVLGTEQPLDEQFELADFNNDNVLNVVDIVNLINLILA